MAEHEPCALCGRLEHFDLLDTCRDGDDDQRLVCVACYGPGDPDLGPWGPASPGAIVRSVCPDLADLYAAWLDEYEARQDRRLSAAHDERWAERRARYDAVARANILLHELETVRRDLSALPLPVRLLWPRPIDRLRAAVDAALSAARRDARDEGGDRE